MLRNIVKSSISVLIIGFFILVFKYYFSEKNIDLIKNKKNNLEAKTLENLLELPVLSNDTNDVIDFNSGFDNSNKPNYKRSFWELFK